MLGDGSLKNLASVSPSANIIFCLSINGIRKHQLVEKFRESFSYKHNNDLAKKETSLIFSIPTSDKLII